MSDFKNHYGVFFTNADGKAAWTRRRTQRESLALAKTLSNARVIRVNHGSDLSWDATTFIAMGDVIYTGGPAPVRYWAWAGPDGARGWCRTEAKAMRLARRAGKRYSPGSDCWDHTTWSPRKDGGSYAADGMIAVWPVATVRF